MRPEQQHPATPSSLERQQVQRDLEGIPNNHFPHWGKTFDYERNQVHFLLLPEFWEQGLLTPTEEGYAYEEITRLECDDIYCNRYLDAIQTRSRASSTGAAASAYEISNQGGYVPESSTVMAHPRSNPIQPGEMAPYSMVNPHYLQQSEFYNSMNLVYPVIEEQLTAQQSMHMDTTSDSTSGPDLRPPNPLWNSDMYDQVYLDGYRWV